MEKPGIVIIGMHDPLPHSIIKRSLFPVVVSVLISNRRESLEDLCRKKYVLKNITLVAEKPVEEKIKHDVVDHRYTLKYPVTPKRHGRVRRFNRKG